MCLRGRNTGGDLSVFVRSLSGTSGEPAFGSVYRESWGRFLSWVCGGCSAVASCFILWTSLLHEALLTCWQETHHPACTLLSVPGAVGLAQASQCVPGVGGEGSAGGEGIGSERL